MTEEYKDTLLKYLTGNLNNIESTTDDKVKFFDYENKLNNLQQNLLDELSSTNVSFNSIYNENYKEILLYGYYDSGYFLALCDESFNLIKTFTEYKSGTAFTREFVTIGIDEKNRVYGIDVNPNNSDDIRFIMLNNIFASQEVDLKISYILDSNKFYGATKIFKSPTSAEYLVIGKENNKIYATKMTINVGSTNEYVKYTYSGSELYEYKVSSIYINWGENFEFQIPQINDENNPYLTVFQSNNNQTITSTNYNIVSDGNFYAGYVETFAKDYFYILLRNSQNTLFGVMINGFYETLKEISFSNGTSAFSRMQTINNAVFYVVEQANSSTSQMSFGVYIPNKINSLKSIPLNTGFINFNLGNFLVTSVFNLFQFNIQFQDTLYSIQCLKEDNINFNDIGEYSNDLKPKTMSLYEDNEILFNRDLYNLVVNGSTTTSTVEVPNTMLNSNTIDGENLIGNHYLQIANNTEEITTNEYETLHINTINTLSMINLDTSVLNPSGSSRLNNSTNLTQDYNNAKANKVRINYSDDTNYTFELGKSQITESSGVYTYTFAVYVPKTITNIQIMSNDEVTTYQTITGTFEIGKYYQITQEVTI